MSAEPRPTILVRDVRASEKNPIARLTFGFWADRAATDTMVQVTNPIAQHLAFYVREEEKTRFIKELRAVLDTWERTK